MFTSSARYSKLMMTFHWLTAVLVLAAYLTSENQSEKPTHSQFTHAVLGMWVLALTLSRLVARFAGGVPPPLESTHNLMARLAHLGHLGIYFLLLAVPLTGWFTLSRLGLRIELFGLPLPLLSPPVRGEPGLIANIHQIGGNLLLIIAATHVGVAFWHHFWLRDQTLRRMSPIESRSQARRSRY
jgi:cytochrome b561